MKSEITLPITELKQALPGIGKLVGKSRSLPVLQSVRVQRSAQGAVTLEATDLDANVAYQFKDEQPGDAAEVLVPYDALNKVIKGSSESLTVSPDGKYVAFVSNRGGLWQIWAVPIDGGEPIALAPIQGSLTHGNSSDWLEHAIQWVK